MPSNLVSDGCKRVSWWVVNYGKQSFAKIMIAFHSLSVYRRRDNDMKIFNHISDHPDDATWSARGMSSLEPRDWLNNFRDCHRFDHKRYHINCKSHKNPSIKFCLKSLGKWWKLTEKYRHYGYIWAHCFTFAATCLVALSNAVHTACPKFWNPSVDFKLLWASPTYISTRMSDIIPQRWTKQ